MKKMLQIIATVSILLSATFANASTILTPNNADVDFIVYGDFNFSAAVFENEANLNLGSILTSISFTTIPATPVSPALSFGEAIIGVGNSFVVGISTDGGINWIADNGYSGGTTGVVSFSIAAPVDAGILLVDVEQVASVPVPAALWMFGSGLIGLVGVARRKSS